MTGGTMAGAQQQQQPQPPRQTTGPSGQAGWDWTPAGGGGGAPGGGGGQTGAGAGGAGGGGAGGAPAPLQNTTSDDPDIRYLIDQYKSRLSQAPEQRAQEQAASGIRDASSGLQKELGGNLASRGMLGGGVENQMRNQLGEQALRAIGKSNASIQSQRQSDLDKMVLGGEGLMKAPSANALSQQGLGLQQYQIQQQGDIQRAQLQQNAQIEAQRMQIQQAQLAMQQQQAAMQLWGQYMQMF